MPANTSYEIVSFAEEHRQGVIHLWQECGLTRSWNDPDKDIDRKLKDPVGRLLVLLCREPERPDAEPQIAGSVMVGYDGHRGSIYYLAIAPKHQGKGLGQKLMAYCEAFLTELGCPKINLFVRADNEAATGFYNALGYVMDTSPAYGKRLIPDD